MAIRGLIHIDNQESLEYVFCDKTCHSTFVYKLEKEHGEKAVDPEPYSYHDDEDYADYICDYCDEKIFQEE